MELECVKEKLQTAISNTERATSKNTTLPILNYVLLVANGSSLKIRATNLDLGIEFEIPAKIKKEGSVAVPGGILNNVLSGIYNSEGLKINTEKDNLIISTPQNSVLINSIKPDDFPTIPTIKDGILFKINSKDFTNGIKSVLYSASTSDIKPEISSLFLYQDGENIVFVSTDSFRLAEKKIKYKNIEEFTGVIIPLKNINEIVKVFENIDSEIDIKLNSNQISFYIDGIYTTSRIITGVFPDYKQIIPKDFLTEVVILKQDLLNVFKISSIFSDKFNKTNIKIDPKNNLFEINSKNQQTGEYKTKLDASLSGEKVDFVVNYKYIIDCLNFIPQESITILLNQENKPIVIKGLGDDSFTYLVMPMNR